VAEKCTINIRESAPEERRSRVNVAGSIPRFPRANLAIIEFAAKAIIARADKMATRIEHRVGLAIAFTLEAI